MRHILLTRPRPAWRSLRGMPKNRLSALSAIRRTCVFGDDPGGEGTRPTTIWGGDVKDPQGGAPTWSATGTIRRFVNEPVRQRRYGPAGAGAGHHFVFVPQQAVVLEASRAAGRFGGDPHHLRTPQRRAFQQGEPPIQQGEPTRSRASRGKVKTEKVKVKYK